MSILHRFNGSDGETPSALIFGADGNFYGTTRSGGQFGDGTIFKMTPIGELTTVHNFGGDDGIEPNGLVQDQDGSFYGTTRRGGSNNEGTIFKLTLPNSLSTLHEFDAGRPFGGLVKAANGDFYGRSGGGIFKITSGGNFMSFPGGFGYNQSGPNVDRRGLSAGADGNLYGTQDNFPLGPNSIFRMTPDGEFKTLYSVESSFDPPPSFFPDGVIEGADGNLYGRSVGSRGPYVYRLTPGGQFTTISDLVGSGGSLILGQDGNLYGISTSGNDPAFFFRLTVDGMLTNLYTEPANGNIDDASEPLLQRDDITFFGIHSEGGSSGKGTIYEISLVNLPPVQLLNVSTRLRVQTGDNVLIGGFIITGDAPKRIVVRGIGPSLVKVGISGALLDPVLELHKPDGAIVLNDNWKSTQQAEIEATGVAPAHERESAIVATLDPANYTAIVRGAGESTGVGLVEAYDLNAASGSQLANISTRGFVETGENVLIGGIIAGPDGTPDSTALVRAIGPSLRRTGVPNALSDPTLELRDGNGELLAFNDEWKDSQADEIEETGIPPENDSESAILTTLTPGNYTAIVRGFGNSTGVGLVEVYRLSN